MTDTERAKIEENIRQLEQMKASGVMPSELADASIAALKKELATYTADLEGDGAVAQGTNAKAVGKDGTLVEGDYVADGGKLEKHYYVPEGASPAELRTAYLHHLFESVSQLQLSGIDPKTASDAEARLNLAAVYTALITLSSEFDENLPTSKDQGLNDVNLNVYGAVRRQTAVEQLNRQSRLVLLGDPGSGKSTFVNFVAMCLAGEVLGTRDANLAALTAPLPVDNPNGQKDDILWQQPWDHGFLLPIRVILRDFAARGVSQNEKNADAKSLWNFIVSELDNWALIEYKDAMLQELLEKGGLLLLDGLDEVPEANLHRVQIKNAIESFSSSFPKCRILVTSRTYSYQKQNWRLNGFAESILASFTKNQIQNFIERWYKHIAVVRHWHSEDAQGHAELLTRAILHNPQLIGLAERPLLLTLMASLHAWRGGTLPERREELYADAVDLLLDWWESPKVVRDGYGELIVRQPSLAEWLRVDRQKMRSLLEELAFKAHMFQAELTGTADISESDLVSGLMRLSHNPDINPRQLIDYLSLRAGLLIPRGIGIYTFPHRTFQEYLTACYLTDHDYPEKAAELVSQDFNRWRETALLAGAKAARGTASAIWLLVDALCYADPSKKTVVQEQWGPYLAAQALVESGRLNNIGERNLPKYKRLQKWLIYILESGQIPVSERSRAGKILGILGDIRFDKNSWYLPNDREKTGLFGLLHVPAGEFLMGSNDISDDEKPLHLLNLSYDFWLAKYPVTVEQYRVFTELSGYKTRYEYSLKGGNNDPVTNVVWYDALNYCTWLGNELCLLAKKHIGKRKYLTEHRYWKLIDGLASGQLQVTLPSEAEWEKSARGADGRTYPWGGTPSTDFANYNETGIGSVSPVGIFPGGVSPYGAHDMSGNVWEWTRTISSHDFPYPYQVNDGREDLRNQMVPRVLRGGSYVYNPKDSSCAYRYYHFVDSGDPSVGFRVAVVPSLK